MRRAIYLQALALLALQGACKTSLTAHGDAGRDGATAKDDVPIARGADTADAAGRDATVDLPLSDGAPVASAPPPTFRFDNQTDDVVYVEVDTPVGCRTRTASGWQECRFFGFGCLFSCDSLVAGQSCCVLCERPVPAVYDIPGRTSRVIPWSGRVFDKAAGACSECECQQSIVASGEFQATARVFSAYRCDAAACATGVDGTIQNATGRGAESALGVLFTMPSSRPEIVFRVGSDSVIDAGTVAD